MMKKKTTTHLSTQKGFTLLELVIGLALSALAVLGLGTMVINSQKSGNNVFRSLDKESIRNKIRLQMNCEHTIDKISDDGRDEILYNHKDEELFNSLSKFGKTLMDAGNFYLQIESYDNNTGEFVIIFDKKQTRSTSIGTTLFRTVPFYCKP